MPLPTPAHPRATPAAPRKRPTATATPAARQTPEPTVVRQTPLPVIRETPEPVRETPAPTPASTPVPTATPTPERKPPPAEKPTPEPEQTAAPTAPSTLTATPRSKPKATPTPAASATPPPPVPTPTPRDKEEPPPTPTVRPTAKRSRILQEKPVRAAEPRPTDFARPKVNDQSDNIGGSRPTFDFSNRPDRDVASTVKRMENKWQAAIREHDVKALNDLLASDFVGTSSTGKVGSKYTLISALRKDKNTYTSVEARSMSVRTPSDDTAIVTGVTREAGMTPEGKRFKSSRRFTDTWVKRNGKWRCVASQTTDL